MPLCDLKTVLMHMQGISSKDNPVTEPIISISGDTRSHPPPLLPPRWFCCRRPETSCLHEPNGNTVFLPYMRFHFLRAQSLVVNHGPEADDPSSDVWSGGHSGLTLRHKAYVTPLTSSHHVGMMSSHVVTRRRVGTVQ